MKHKKYKLIAISLIAVLTLAACNKDEQKDYSALEDTKKEEVAKDKETSKDKTSSTDKEVQNNEDTNGNDTSVSENGVSDDNTSIDDSNGQVTDKGTNGQATDKADSQVTDKGTSKDNNQSVSDKNTANNEGFSADTNLKPNITNVLHKELVKQSEKVEMFPNDSIVWFMNADEVKNKLKNKEIVETLDVNSSLDDIEFKKQLVSIKEKEFLGVKDVTISYAFSEILVYNENVSSKSADGQKLSRLALDKLVLDNIFINLPTSDYDRIVADLTKQYGKPRNVLNNVIQFEHKNTNLMLIKDEEHKNVMVVYQPNNEFVKKFAKK